MENKGMNSPTVRVPPVLVLSGAGAAQILLQKKPLNRARAVCAALVGAVSAGMLASSVLRFRQQDTTVNPVQPEAVSSLVTSGPNAISRNPMYLGMTGLLCANALWRGRWRAAVPAAAFAVWIDRVQIPPEEVALEERFGQEYEAYRSRVPRWLVWT